MMVPLGADPASQLGDQFVIRGVVAPLSVVQEQRTQHPRGVLPARHRIRLVRRAGDTSTIGGHQQPRLVRMKLREHAPIGETDRSSSRRIVLALGRPCRGHQSPPGSSSSIRSSSGRKLTTRLPGKHT
jgi:hypothetical protein